MKKITIFKTKNILASIKKNYEIKISVFYSEIFFKIKKKDFEKAMKKLDEFID